MSVQLARNWWALVLRGIAAILFGVVAILLPGITLELLVLIFGAYALADGVLAVIGALNHRQMHDRWWLLLLEGAVGILVGILAVINPGMTALALLYFVAAWGIVTGALEIIAAFRLRREIEGEWLLGIGGALSILFGILVALFPGLGALAVIWLVAIYAILFGALLITLGLRVQGWGSPKDIVTPRTA